MRRSVGAFLATALVLSTRCGVTADAPDAKEVINKALRALGGEAKLAALEAKAVATKTKGTLRYGGNVGDLTITTTTMGLNKFREEFKGDSDGNEVKSITVLNGDKAWRKFADSTSQLEDKQLADQKRAIYLAIVPATVLPLKREGFKVQSARNDKVDNKPAFALKIVGPDNKVFELFFDKESGLPVKMLTKIGDESIEETTYGNYKEFDGVKRATKIERKRYGEKFMDVEVTEVKVLDKLDPTTFAEPH
jgi:hypothetical protein